MSCLTQLRSPGPSSCGPHGRRSCSRRWSGPSGRPAPGPATRRSCWPTARWRGSSAGRAPSRPRARRRCGCSTRASRGCCGSPRAAGPTTSRAACTSSTTRACPAGRWTSSSSRCCQPRSWSCSATAPVARALVRVGTALDHDVRLIDDPGAGLPADTAAVVVASHGRDEAALLAAALRRRLRPRTWRWWPARGGRRGSSRSCARGRHRRSTPTEIARTRQFAPGPARHIARSRHGPATGDRPGVRMRARTRSVGSRGPVRLCGPGAGTPRPTDRCAR